MLAYSNHHNKQRPFALSPPPPFRPPACSPVRCLVRPQDCTVVAWDGSSDSHTLGMHTSLHTLGLEHACTPFSIPDSFLTPCSRLLWQVEDDAQLININFDDGMLDGADCMRKATRPLPLSPVASVCRGGVVPRPLPLSTLALLANYLPGLWAGSLSDRLGYAHYFLFALSLAIPGILSAWFAKRHFQDA